MVVGRHPSPIDTPLYDAIGRVVATRLPRAPPCCPASSSAAPTPASSASVARSPTASGCSRPSVTYRDFSTRFHGIDERIDVESLRLTTEAWLNLCRDFLGG